MDLEWLSMMMMAALVPAAIACVAWRNRSALPIAARLFIAAAVCLLLPLGITTAEEFLGLNDVFELLESPGEDNQDQLTILEDQFQPGSSGWQRMIARQLITSGFQIIAWSLMTWAILRQPDDRSRAVIAPR